MNTVLSIFCRRKIITFLMLLFGLTLIVSGCRNNGENGQKDKYYKEGYEAGYEEGLKKGYEACKESKLKEEE